MPTLILTTPTNPGVASWTDSTLLPVYPSGPAGGDLSGTFPNPLVVGFNGIPIDTGAPANGDVLTYNSLSNQWEHSPIIGGGGPPTGPAGGDLGGLYPNPTVVGLQSNPVDNAAPALDDVLAWDGVQWTPTDPTTIVSAASAIYGAFSSTADQALSANVPYVITYTSTDGANGTVLQTGLNGASELKVLQDGVYEITASLQMLHTGGTTVTIIFWLRVNGLDLPNSASSIEMGNNNNRTLPFVPIILPLNANDYVEWVILTTGTNTSVEHFPAVVGPPAIPAIPSIIAGVKRLGA